MNDRMLIQASAEHMTAAAPEKLFPHWTLEEQDFWFECFHAYSEQLLDQIPDELVDAKIGSHSQEQQLRIDAYHTEKIQLAAKLADQAVKEMQYRFYRQKPVFRQEPGNGSRRRGGDDRKHKRERRPVRSR